jgi:hypothetical protein
MTTENEISEGTSMPNTASPKAATLAAVPASPSPPANDHCALVERWWNDHFPGSPVAQSTRAWNHAFAAKEELKRRLATPHTEEN